MLNAVGGENVEILWSLPFNEVIDTEWARMEFFLKRKRNKTTNKTRTDQPLFTYFLFVSLLNQNGDHS